MRTTKILALSLAGVLGLACNDPTSKQQEADKAREQARQESDKAALQAEQTRLEQQAKADEKQREATQTLERARADYRVKLNDVMSDLDRHAADVRAKNITASAKDKTANADRIAQLETKRQLLSDDLKDVDRATAQGWEDLKTRLDGHIRDARTLMLPFTGKT